MQAAATVQFSGLALSRPFFQQRKGALVCSFTLMPRSAWKGPFFVAFPGLRQAIQNGTPIATQARSCTILPSFVGLKFLVHNGKDYLPVHITEEMIGHKLGEFAFTRKRFSYRFTKAK